MKPRDLRDLLLLAALWGGSFLFMRVAAPELGPLALIELRVLIAALVLLPFLAMRRGLGLIVRHAVPMTVLGVINSALPFCLFAYAMLSVSAGFASILNATTPLWGALVAWLWLGERLAPLRIAGLAIGFAGIVVLSWGKASFVPGGSGMALLAAMAATLSYGVAASYARRRLEGVDALAVATGSQLGAALVLAPLALAWWPAQPVSAAAWASTVVMGVACTGIAYVLYFRLIERAGPSRAITVTFLVPVFAVIWGALALGETVSAQMVAGGVVILLGTALSTGAIGSVGRRRPADTG